LYGRNGRKNILKCHSRMLYSCHHTDLVTAESRRHCKWSRAADLEAKEMNDSYIGTVWRMKVIDGMGMSRRIMR
jgi:hypothetical protein